MPCEHRQLEDKPHAFLSSIWARNLLARRVLTNRASGGIIPERSNVGFDHTDRCMFSTELHQAEMR